ncbi:hypothetical protein NGRA_2050 [Nosema granulosis]|uniref:Transcription initiation factor IIF subunit alpha n=1 Tax=Nosema granulosis TaxID=83296 RepID=A0A9P6H029_9MICR|nr:hypothetical protein NGRA_2050 [Nosema granulosis]
MKKFKIIYDPEYGKKKFMFTNLNIKRLNPPLTVTREKPIEEEVVFNSKKKSELVEYEDEEYLKLKSKESCPLLLEDSDNICYLGKLQTVNSNNSSYFTFIREGSVIYITPIRKWYRFTQKISSMGTLDEDEISKAVPEIPIIETNVDSDKEEIDYEEEFDDDEGEDFNFKISEEKKLSKAGRKLRNIVENLEKEDESEEEEVENKHSEEPKKLSKGQIRKFFTSKTISLRELIKNIKKTFSLDTEEKNTLKEFISENCTYETEPTTNERLLKLK